MSVNYILKTYTKKLNTYNENEQINNPIAGNIVFVEKVKTL